jgi:nicotinate dehydrogenase subunit A
MPAVTLKVNGRSHALDVDPDTPLLHVLTAELALRGPKLGCGLAQCGSCMVLVDGAARPSCVTPAGSVAGAEITTLEGLGTPERPHPIQRAFIGVILTAKALLDREPRASEARIREALDGILCRCFAHARMLRAIQRYARERT